MEGGTRPTQEKMSLIPFLFLDGVLKGHIKYKMVWDERSCVDIAVYLNFSFSNND